MTTFGVAASIRKVCNFFPPPRYYDGLLWGSMFVQWRGFNPSDHVVRVSAMSAPHADIGPGKLLPLWWLLFPPSADVLRGVFWSGYLDAMTYFDKNQTVMRRSGVLCCARLKASRAAQEQSGGKGRGDDRRNEHVAARGPTSEEFTKGSSSSGRDGRTLLSTSDEDSGVLPTLLPSPSLCGSNALANESTAAAVHVLTTDQKEPRGPTWNEDLRGGRGPTRNEDLRGGGSAKSRRDRKKAGKRAPAKEPSVGSGVQPSANSPLTQQLAGESAPKNHQTHLVYSFAHEQRRTKIPPWQAFHQLERSADSLIKPMGEEMVECLAVADETIEREWSFFLLFWVGVIGFAVVWLGS